VPKEYFVESVDERSLTSSLVRNRYQMPLEETRLSIKTPETYMKIQIEGIQPKHILYTLLGVALIVGILSIGRWPDLYLSMLVDWLHK
jgi:hypothetical protein